MNARGEALRIGRLRARGEAADRPAQRLAIERGLERSELAPRGLPPGAVLIVRRIEQRIAADSAWTEAVRERLDELYRRAARPERGRIAQDSEAVLFRDRAEWLACLARDLAEGRARERWWWQALLAQWPAGPGPSPTICAAWIEHAQRLPAVLEQLQAWHATGAVLEALEAGDARRVLAALAGAHDLRLVAQALHTPTASGTPQAASGVAAREVEPPAEAGAAGAATGGRAGGGGESPGTARPPVGGGPASRPWAASTGSEDARRVGEIAARMSAGAAGPRALLLGLGLALARAPWRVRSAAFQTAALRRWMPEIAPAGPAGDDPPQRRDRPPAPRIASAARPDAPAPASRPAPGPAPGDDTQPDGSVAGREGADAQGPAGPRPPPSALATARGQPREPQAGGPIPAGPEPGARAEPARLPREAEGLTTGLGGVLYLINLMLALDLPDALEDDGAGGIGPWALLELLARALLGAQIEAHADDALWGALARLDGRDPRTAAGAGHAPRFAYRLPARWQAALEDEGAGYRWACARGWLRLWSEAGWMLAERPRYARALAVQLHEEHAALSLDPARAMRRAAYASAPIARGRCSPDPALGRLLGLILPCLRRRLALALGAEAREASALTQLLRLRARVYVTSSHVDLVARLDDVSLPARRAGLDRDPGWLPSFGRVVLFHFE